MSWNQISPGNTKHNGRTAMVSITIRKRGRFVSPQLNIADSLLTKLGGKTGFSHVRIHEGVDENYGKLKVERAPADDEKAFKVTHLKHGGGFIIFKPIAATPDTTRAVLNCKLDEELAYGFTITLPMEEWAAQKAQLAETMEQARAKQAIQEARPNGKLNIEGKLIPDGNQPLNPIEYLTKKGHKVHRRPDGMFDVDGDLYTSNTIVALINKSRVKAGLGNITVLHLHIPE